jgi:ABC-type Zn uptake system ZnuABC Zn-binding protein ZnuA
VRALVDRFSEVRPSGAAYFRNRFDEFSRQLTIAEETWNARLRPYRGRKVITYRRSWSSFLKYFQLVSVGEIEPSPGISPNRRHTMELIDVMKHEGAKVILVEPYFEMRTPNMIARETGATVVVMPPSVGAKNIITDYFTLFDYDSTLLEKAFRASP